MDELRLVGKPASTGYVVGPVEVLSDAVVAARAGRGPRLKPTPWGRRLSQLSRSFRSSLHEPIAAARRSSLSRSRCSGMRL